MSIKISAIRIFFGGPNKKDTATITLVQARQSLEERESKRCPLYTNKEHRAPKRFLIYKLTVCTKRLKSQ